MKISLVLILVNVFCLGLLGQNVDDACNWNKTVKKRLKQDLEPYHYYSLKVTNIVFSKKSQFIEIEVPLVGDGNYRFVFNKEGVQQNVKIEVYDKPANNINRKKVFDEPKDERHFVYTTADEIKLNRVYVNYIIPASNSTNPNIIQKGCVLFYSGFLN